MKKNGFVACVVLMAIDLLAWNTASAQSSVRDMDQSTDAEISATPGRSGVSPGARQVAELIGLQSALEQLESLRVAGTSSESADLILKTLALRQGITETVVSASLEVDGVLAEIYQETAHLSELRAVLESRRDRVLGVNAVANIVTSGGMGVVGSLLQMNESTARWGNGVGAVAGGVSTLLSMVGLHQQKGGQIVLRDAPNMLARIFDRAPGLHSQYPPEVWSYLDSAPPNDSSGESRRQRLIRDWIADGRIQSGQDHKNQQRIDRLTSASSSEMLLTIDFLADRQAMLADVAAAVSLMKRDLSKLMLVVRTQ